MAACSPAEPTPPPAVVTSPAHVVSASASAPPATPASSEAPASPSPSPAGPVFSFDPNASPDPGPTQAPGDGYALLDGVKAPEAARLLLPVAVMVDDNVQARPQYGFNTRLDRLPGAGRRRRDPLHDGVPGEATRSASNRCGAAGPYFVNWASEYRAAFAHYGGDMKTLLYLPTHP